LCCAACLVFVRSLVGGFGRGVIVELWLPVETEDALH
jgi:hypothetical protein